MGYSWRYVEAVEDEAGPAKRDANDHGRTVDKAQENCELQQVSRMADESWQNNNADTVRTTTDHTV